MNLQIDYLRTFIVVADTKGFTRAGIQVNRSQSAVSKQIKRLENGIRKKGFLLNTDFRVDEKFKI